MLIQKKKSLTSWITSNWVGLHISILFQACLPTAAAVRADILKFNHNKYSRSRDWPKTAVFESYITKKKYTRDLSLEYQRWYWPLGGGGGGYVFLRILREKIT